MNRTTYSIEVSPVLPPRLARLAELANDLWYSWDRPTHALFHRLDPALWHACEHSPKSFLQQVDQRKLLQAADDPTFLSSYARVIASFDAYREDNRRRHSAQRLSENDLVAYFCAEFGFHESFPIYSGGLGILAGDHCKTASDMRVPMIGVGLLYRQGYFRQTVDRDGNQSAVYVDSDFNALPLVPVKNADGNELHVAIDMPGRNTQVKVWQVSVGHMRVLLLDTDLEQNSEHDRDIAHLLYGGDRTTRIEQELVLGVGGVRALAAMGENPTAWHINEGHAAFLILERIRLLMQEGLSFEEALEAVAVNTTFTTHTVVPAGHDRFSDEMIRTYFGEYCARLGIESWKLLQLGRTEGSHDFNMTALAIRGSRFQNAVSMVHSQVSSRLYQELWPQIDAEDNPMAYVTNGVHALTFLASDWHPHFDRYIGYDWSERLIEAQAWKRAQDIPDHIFWSTHQSLKAQMLRLIQHRLASQLARNLASEAHLQRLLKYADPAHPNVLTIGFARRFATYKRATLIFENLDWLREIVSDPNRPVLLVFAGKAHPADKPGQELIRRIAEIARMPDFEGRVLFVEGYDLQLSRRLVSGCDVWLNNPVYPQEASGTSGMKAGINGVINLSVLDGWWEEGYDGTNGWAIKPVQDLRDPAWRDYDEARTLYETLQDSVVPLYYERGKLDYPKEWVALAKRSMASIMPHFNSTRMLNEYVGRFYMPASQHCRRFHDEGYAKAKALAAWKARTRAAWDGVRIERMDVPVRKLVQGETKRVEVAADVNGMDPRDLAIELVLKHSERPGDTAACYRLPYAGESGGHLPHRYALDFAPQDCGRLGYRLRAYPWNELLTHRFEMGLLHWL
jgi:starch phosphorylase